ncbi:MAG TPA: YraN family protein [Dehalococcoidia bacterium]|jgi:putative endonuclease|nr:YraN family protein [Dehalococcoidia bacterium]
MNDRAKLLGVAGERIASEYLEKQGYFIREKNVEISTKNLSGQIPVIAEKGDLTVFVAVKLRTSRKQGPSLNNISPAKLAKLRALGSVYSKKNKIPAEQQFRVDLVSIELTVGGDVGQLTHVQGEIEAGLEVVK